MKKISTILIIFIAIILIASCKKTTTPAPVPPPVNPCAAKTIVVTGTTISASNATAANGSVVASATGSTGFTYSINGTTFQATGNFSGLAAGSYTVTAKDADACTGTQSFSINAASCPTITAAPTPTTTVKCAGNTGTLSLAGSGGASPYTYSINGGAFQATGLFSSLAFGTVAFVVKDANGCSSSGSSTINYAPAGPLFSAVKNILNTYCTSCHGSPSGQNGINYNDDCVIISQKARIKARAVDANPSQMPPSGAGLTVAERTAVTAWVNAGGNYSN